MHAYVYLLPSADAWAQERMTVALTLFPTLLILIGLMGKSFFDFVQRLVIVGRGGDCLVPLHFGGWVGVAGTGG